MTQAAADALTIWAPAIRQRRKAMLQRIVMGAATALVFSPMLGWRFSAIWLVLYVLIQCLEVEVFRPVVSGQVAEPVGWRGFYGDLVLMLNAGFFGLIAVPLWILGGAMGGVAASVLLSAGMINSVIMSGGSMRIFACTVLPQLAIFALTPLFMAQLGAPPHIVTAVAVAILTYTAFCLNTRRHLFRANRAETTARIEADRKRTEAEAAMASRGAFLAAVAHDLRTPLNRMKAKMEVALIDAEAGRTSGVEALGVALDEADALLKTFNTVLAIARLQAGGAPEPKVFDAADLAADMAELYEPAGEDKGLEFAAEVEKGLFIEGNQPFLAQALANLIDNAIKYTPEGGAVMFRARRRSSGDVEFSVTDNGPGVPDEDRERVLQRFVRLDNSRTEPGSGLGLSLVTAVAEAHGGRVQLDEGPGAFDGRGPGLRVALILPAATRAPDAGAGA